MVEDAHVYSEELGTGHQIKSAQMRAAPPDEITRQPSVTL